MLKYKVTCGIFLKTIMFVVLGLMLSRPGWGTIPPAPRSWVYAEAVSWPEEVSIFAWLSVFIMRHHWILSNDFSVALEMIVCFCPSINMTYCINGVSDATWLWYFVLFLFLSVNSASHFLVL